MFFIRKNTIMFMLCFFMSIAVHAFTYYVEWPKSYPKLGIHILTITINNCQTSFEVKTEDLKRLSDDDEALRKLAKIAIIRERKGCKSKN